MSLLLHDVAGAASGGGRVPGPPSGRGRAVCAPGCARPMHFKASRFTNRIMQQQGHWPHWPSFLFSACLFSACLRRLRRVGSDGDGRNCGGTLCFSPSTSSGDTSASCDKGYDYALSEIKINNKYVRTVEKSSVLWAPSPLAKEGAKLEHIGDRTLMEHRAHSLTLLPGVSGAQRQTCVVPVYKAQAQRAS